MNETINNLIDRRSVRAYTEKAIPEEAMELILKAGTYAPSGMGRQPVVFVAVEKKEVRDRLSRMNAAIMGTDSDPFYGAPAVIVVLADRSVPTCLYDGSLAMGNLMTAAHSLGIDSCWIHRAKEEFDSPEGKHSWRNGGFTEITRESATVYLDTGAVNIPRQSPEKKEL